MIKKTYKISGMHCPSCAVAIEMDLEDIGVRAKVSYAKGEAETEFDEKSVTEDKIRETLSKAGYRVM